MTDGEDTFSARLGGLLTGGGILFFGLVLELGISFLAKILIAKYLGKVDYGVVSIGVTMAAITSILALVGLNTGIGRYLPRQDGKGHRRGVLLSGFQVAVPVAVLAGAVLFILSPLIAADVFHTPSATPILRIFAIVVPFSTVMKLSVGSIQGLQLSTPRVLVENVTFPLVRFSGIVLAVVVGLGSLGVAGAYAFSYVAAALLGVYFLWRRTALFDSGVEWEPQHRELLAFSAPLVVTAAMTIVFSDIDTFMLGFFINPAAVGVYNVVYPIAELLQVAFAAVGFLFMPALSELHADGQTDEMRRLYQIVTKWIFAVTFPVFVVVALLPALTIRLTFGIEYDGGATALSVLALAFFAHAVAGPNGKTLTSIGRTKLLMIDNVVAASVNLALNLVLIPRYSFLGAAAATTAAYLLLNALYATQLYWETGIHPFTRVYAKTSVLGLLLMGAVAFLLRASDEPTLSVSVAILGGFGFLYSLVVFRYGVEQEEIELVLEFEERTDLELGPLKYVAKRLRSQ